jgi:hypothetical protein
MEFPLNLPEELSFIKKAESQQELLALLGVKPYQLIHFLECAAKSSTFVASNPDFIRSSYILLTSLFKDKKLDKSLITELLTLTRKNHERVKDLLPKDLTIPLHHTFVESAFLFASLSPFVFTRVYEGNLATYLKNLTEEQYALFREYIYTGSCERGWQLSYQELYSLYQLAEELEIQELSLFLSSYFTKYFKGEGSYSYLTSLIDGFKKSYTELMKVAQSTLTDTEAGFEMPIIPGELCFKCIRLSSKTTKFLEELSPVLTHLIIDPKLFFDPEMIEWVKKCKNVRHLDISLGNHYPQALLKAADQELKWLALECSRWLNDETLREVIALFPHLEKLYLRENTEITSRGLSALHTLKKLEFIDLSLCTQIDPRTVKIIEAACPEIQVIKTDHCPLIK